MGEILGDGILAFWNTPDVLPGMSSAGVGKDSNKALNRSAMWKPLQFLVVMPVEL